MGKSTLIIIHGVGDAKPGATLDETCRGLGLQVPDSEPEILEIGDHEFPRRGIQHPALEEIIEVNWSDVARPARTPFAVFDFWTRIIVTMLLMASASPGLTNSPPVSAYRTSFEGLLVYCIYPPLLALLCVTLTPEGGLTALVLALSGAIIVCAVTWYLSRFGAAFRSGWVWAAAIAMGGAAFAFGALSAAQMVWIATIIYAVAQVIAGVLLLFALVATLWRDAVPMDRRIAKMAMLYFPFFILSAAGAILWVIALAAVKSVDAAAENFRLWNLWFTQALHDVGYDLALIEFTFSALVALVGLGIIGVVVIYLKRARQPVTGTRNAGEFARDGVRFVFAAGAAAFALLSIVYALASAFSFRTELSETALEVYAISSLRIVPYLAFMIGPLAFVAGMIVDVLFYVVPHPLLSTAKQLRDRLRSLIGHVRAPIVLVAHSQGSVIAIDVIGRSRDAPIRFITAGSPICSLYERFLGSTPESRAEALGETYVAPPHWENFSRQGDYIGAKQSPGVATEIDLGRGGHTGYWRVKELWSTVFPANR